MLAFWLVLAYDLLEERCTDDVIIKTFKTNRFQVAVRLFSNRSQRNGGTNQRFNGRINVFIEAKRGKEEKKEGEEVTEGEWSRGCTWRCSKVSRH